MQSPGLSVTLSSPGGADGELALSTSWDAEKEFAAINRLKIKSVFKILTWSRGIPSLGERRLY